MDLVTHLPTTSAGFDSVYTVIDWLSKYVYFMPCTASVTADDLAQLFFANAVCKHGMPKCIISNHDPHFTSRFWTQLFNSLGCKQALSTAYHPETDGQSEWFHRSVEQVLHCYVSATQTDWDHFLPFCQFALNSTRSATTGFLPAVVVFGREPTLPMEHDVWAVTDGQVESVAHRLEHITLVNHTVHATVTKASEYMAQYANRSWHTLSYAVGDYVWLFSKHLSFPSQLSHKLAAKFVGPYAITQVVNPVAYCLAVPPTWCIHDVFHFSQLKPTVGFTPGAAFDTPFCPGADSSGEFEVKDILDHCSTRSGMQYLVKWRGYPVAEASWEPLTHLSNCGAILLAYWGRRGIRPSQQGE